ncbi:lipopolysaccharide assembly LapA domain-containing protein [Ottowia sp.]|uniref:LapA family protein n=1 Tax=Ottowia sp. TaxID=1898956 RepID=UPI0039647C1C
MTGLIRLLKWILKAAVFFVLFAFALNNQQDATVHLAFGQQWRAPMTLIVLVAFALGMVVGVLGMLPGWWARRQRPAPAVAVAPQAAVTAMPASPPPDGV